SNEKYLQSKAEKEAKRKRKREEKKSPSRWTRSDETKPTDEVNDKKGVSQSEDELTKNENTECCETKDEEETGTLKKDEANNNKEEDEQETGTSKKDEADNNKEEGVANKKVTNQKITKEIDPFDDPKFSEYYIENEHLFVPTQTSAEKKKDQIDAVNWESFLENKEKIIRKGREFSDELRKKAQQQERER
ncbi:hypothetical protein Tco_0197886, partial [Tanacetum coccineum]